MVLGEALESVRGTTEPHQGRRKILRAQCSPYDANGFLVGGSRCKPWNQAKMKEGVADEAYLTRERSGAPGWREQCKGR